MIEIEAIDVERFVEENRLSLARRSEEVKGRIDADTGVFGWAVEVLVDYLPWEAAKSLYKDDYVAKVEAGEEEKPAEPDLLRLAREFLDYMGFAWEKATNQRGISASRSVIKLGAHLWALGREDLHDLIHDDDLYAPYGAPALVAVCRDLGIAVPANVLEFAGDARNADPYHEPEQAPHHQDKVGGGIEVRAPKKS